MALAFDLIAVITILSLAIDIICCHPDDVNGFCSSVNAMHLQCGNRGNGVTQSILERRGKAGPKGDKGDRGLDATIDHDELERVVQANIQDDITEAMQSYTDLKKTVDRHSREIEILRNESRDRRTTDCSKVDPNSYKSGNESRGVFEIYMPVKFEASCDLSTDGGGWTVIQRRMDGSEDFFRSHTDYVTGFGDVAGEFWIGLDNLYNILQTGDNFQLRIDMEDWDGVKKFAKYSRFDIRGPWKDYTLEIDGYSGTAGDGLSGHNEYKFSSKDHDVDTWVNNCAERYKGAWWYTACHSSNLNGLYHKGGPHSSYADGVNWSPWKGHNYSLKFVEMKIKPTS